jgi:phosphotransferase system  glucose/maltose/N-acetylglucosamine-specific IIC component
VVASQIVFFAFYFWAWKHDVAEQKLEQELEKEKEREKEEKAKQD